MGACFNEFKPQDDHLWKTAPRALPKGGFSEPIKIFRKNFYRKFVRIFNRFPKINPFWYNRLRRMIPWNIHPFCQFYERAFAILLPWISPVMHIESSVNEEKWPKIFRNRHLKLRACFRFLKDIMREIPYFRYVQLEIWHFESLLKLESSSSSSKYEMNLKSYHWSLKVSPSYKIGRFNFYRPF